MVDTIGQKTGSGTGFQTEKDGGGKVAVRGLWQVMMMNCGERGSLCSD